MIAQLFRVRRIRKTQTRPVYFNKDSGRWSSAVNATLYARRPSAERVAVTAQRAYPRDDVSIEVCER